MQGRQGPQVRRNIRIDSLPIGRGRLEPQGQGGPHRWRGRGVVVVQRAEAEAAHPETAAAEPAHAKSTHAISAHAGPARSISTRSPRAIIAAAHRAAGRVGLGRADEALLGRLTGVGADETAGLPGLAPESVRTVQSWGALAALTEAAQGTVAAESTAAAAGAGSAVRRAVAEHARGGRRLSRTRPRDGQADGKRQ